MPVFRCSGIFMLGGERPFMWTGVKTAPEAPCSLLSVFSALHWLVAAAAQHSLPCLALESCRAAQILRRLCSARVPRAFGCGLRPRYVSAVQGDYQVNGPACRSRRPG